MQKGSNDKILKFQTKLVVQTTESSSSSKRNRQERYGRVFSTIRMPYRIINKLSKNAHISIQACAVLLSFNILWILLKLEKFKMEKATISHIPLPTVTYILTKLIRPVFHFQIEIKKAEAKELKFLNVCMMHSNRPLESYRTANPCRNKHKVGILHRRY